MALPTNTAGFVSGNAVDFLPGETEEPCAGAKFHSPRPLFTQRTRLVLEGWDDRLWTRAPAAYLCGTCRDNLVMLLTLLYTSNGDLDWEIRREFGNDLRALAEKGWQFYAQHRTVAQSA